MDFELLKLLKQKRAHIAEREGLELFKVFQNAVLERTVDARPKTKQDLEGIKGWGKKKIEKYGDEILGLINCQEITAPVPKERKLLTVSELLAFLNAQFSNLGTLSVRGEITEISRNPNGYCFFTLKDPETQDHGVSCYAGYRIASQYSHLLEIGMEVTVSAAASLYKTGRFSLTINKIEPFGEGALKKAFEALKNKLEIKGYFADSRKRPIPDFVKKIGIITSESGAAIRDFQNNIGDYGFKLHLLDCRVEGDYAEDSVVSALNWFNKNRPDMDVLILLRGGGSLESLRAFNSERVADAIVMSRIPIMTGIGHERDDTIADYAADLRHSTPTAVAAFLKNKREQLIYTVETKIEELHGAMTDILEDNRNKLDEQTSNLNEAYQYVLRNYKNLYLKMADQMQSGLQNIFWSFRTEEKRFINIFHTQQRNLQTKVYELDKAANFLSFNIQEKIRTAKSQIASFEAALTQQNPETILKKGYGIVYKTGGKVIKNSGDIKIGDKINVKLYKGLITSLVEEVEN